MSLLKWRKTKADNQNGADKDKHQPQPSNQGNTDDSEHQNKADNTINHSKTADSSSQNKTDNTSQKKTDKHQDSSTKTQQSATKVLATQAIDGQDLQAGRVYWFLLAVLVLLILVTGIQNVKQVINRHELYRELLQAQTEYQRLLTEEQRLLIEQQTFSATPIVAKRAKSELMMDYPRPDQHITILAPSTKR